MKKKIVALCLVVCLATVAVCSATFAYLTSTDKAENVFTTGDVKIDLVETFDPENAKLIPGKDVQKVVNVKNTGTEEAYVRVHIAIPAILDSGNEDDPKFAAYNNTLHWNFDKASLADGQWNWHSTNINGTSSYGPGYPENGGAWNCYQITVGGVEYNVYVATYETKLEAETGETATNAIYKVFLDTKVTNEMLAGLTGENGVLKDGIKILVAAEGGQAEGFENAYDALNTQFGNPMDAGYVSPFAA